MCPPNFSGASDDFVLSEVCGQRNLPLSYCAIFNVECNFMFFAEADNFLRTFVVKLSMSSVGGHFLVVVCPSKNNSVSKGHCREEFL